MRQGPGIAVGIRLLGPTNFKQRDMKPRNYRNNNATETVSTRKVSKPVVVRMKQVNGRTVPVYKD